MVNVEITQKLKDKIQAMRKKNSLEQLRKQKLRKKTCQGHTEGVRKRRYSPGAGGAAC